MPAKVPAVLALHGLVLVLTLVFVGCPDPANNGAPSVSVASVAVIPHPENHGVVVAGEAGTLRYLITIVGENVFPVDFLGEGFDIALADGNPLPEGIVLNPGTAGTSGAAYPLSFFVDISYDAVYSLVVKVCGRASAPFYLVVGLPELTGSVTIDGTAEVGRTLQAVASGLPGTGDLFFAWQRALYGTDDFADIPDEIDYTYTVAEADVGYMIRVIVSRAGFTGDVIGGPVGPVPPVLVADRIAALHIGPLPSEVTIVTAIADEQLAPQLLYFGGKAITITLTSYTQGDTLYLDGTGAIFTVGSGVTLVLEDIALWGTHANTSSTIVVEAGAKVYIKDGTTLTWNITDNDTFGGAVTVQAGGTLVMDGGTIEGNISVNGGGVYNRGGTFIMRDGFIMVNDGEQGAGVSNSGRFEMWGGTIAYNIAMRGGGVANHAEGTFLMFDGLIASNLAGDASGALMNIGDFYMHGGQINHNLSIGDVGGIGNEGRVVMTNGVLWNNRDRFDEITVGLPGSGAGNLSVLGGTVSAGRLGFYTIDPNDSRGAGWTRTFGPAPVFRDGHHDGAEFMTIYFFAVPALSYPFWPEQTPVSIGIPRVEIRNGGAPGIAMDADVRLLDVRAGGLSVGTVFPDALGTVSGGALVAAHIVRHGTYIMLNVPGTQVPPLLSTLDPPPLEAENVPWPWTVP